MVQKKENPNFSMLGQEVKSNDRMIPDNKKRVKKAASFTKVLKTISPYLLGNFTERLHLTMYNFHRKQTIIFTKIKCKIDMKFFMSDYSC
ncbi:MAG: hypothetical protein HamCj_10220 [Candidatus Hamiltonella defensa (Ceratovacuna japonica)]